MKAIKLEKRNGKIEIHAIPEEGAPRTRLISKLIADRTDLPDIKNAVLLDIPEDMPLTSLGVTSLFDLNDIRLMSEDDFLELILTWLYPEPGDSVTEESTI